MKSKHFGYVIAAFIFAGFFFLPLMIFGIALFAFVTLMVRKGKWKFDA